MRKSLFHSSGYIWVKSKFFLYRSIIYFSFLLLPVWIQKSLHLNQAAQCFATLLYIIFMVGQWFMLGKEIDHRLKIYFRVNSTFDRIVYRLFLGKIFFILYFNILNLLSPKWVYNIFWVTWAVLGLFYSWPTRGKIIKESVSSNFGEFRFLDRFEKTLFFLILILFIFSIPQLPSIINHNSLKLYFDSNENLSPWLWTFLKVNYYPFLKYPTLFKLAWSLHFYFVNMGLFLFTFYALLRFFVSRRLSLLGVFALLSSWSFTKIMAADYGSTMGVTYSIIWVWTILWVTKSATYRSGLFMGLIGFWGALINVSYAALVLIQVPLMYFIFLRGKTFWFKRQTVKYSLLGIILTLVVYLLSQDTLLTTSPQDFSLTHEFKKILGRKAFFSLSFFGLFILIQRLRYTFFQKNVSNIFTNLKVDNYRLSVFLLSWGFLFIYGVLLEHSLITGFSLMWPITMLSLLPLEIIFQTISRLRSNRNMIYLIYILVCLLDSHFEGRVKIFLRLFN